MIRASIPGDLSFCEFANQRREAERRGSAEASSVRQKPPILTYVLSYPGLGLVKIGQAQYYADRLGHLRTGSPVEPVPVCAFIGAHHERELHNLFAHLRHRLEYFKDAPELRAHLEQRQDRITHEEALKLSPPLTRSTKRQQNA